MSFCCEIFRPTDKVNVKITCILLVLLQDGLKNYNYHCIALYYFLNYCIYRALRKHIAFT